MGVCQCLGPLVLHGLVIAHLGHERLTLSHAWFDGDQPARLRCITLDTVTAESILTAGCSNHLI
jgi:hypothetical protein